MVNSAIIDLIIRLKNGYLAKREVISSPYSTFREKVLVVLKNLKFIKDFSIEGDKPKKKIFIYLLYKDGVPAMTNVKIFSKPGQRIYVSYKKMKPVMGGLGYSILSTSKGILTNYEAKKNKVGGELLFNIW